MSEIPEQPHEKKKRDGPAFSLELGGTRYEFNPTNSDLYLYSELPDADHFYLHGSGRIFRGNMSNFDSIAFFAERNGFPIHPEYYPNDEVYQNFIKRFGAPKLPDFDYITPCKEKQIQFGMYLLDRMSVNELFGGE